MDDAQSQQLPVRVKSPKRRSADGWGVLLVGAGMLFLMVALYMQYRLPPQKVVSTPITPLRISSPAVTTVPTMGWLEYRFHEPGILFRYPEGYKLEEKKDTVMITGSIRSNSSSGIVMRFTETGAVYSSDPDIRTHEASASALLRAGAFKGYDESSSTASGFTRTVYLNNAGMEFVADAYIGYEEDPSTFSAYKGIFEEVLESLQRIPERALANRQRVGCVIVGCYNEYCIADTDEPDEFTAACEYNLQNICVRRAICETQLDGACGFSPTTDFLSCTARINR